MEQGNRNSSPDSPPVDFDAVCQHVRSALEPARAHAVSLHDQRGEVLWLTESSMGPDEHEAVREALEAFSTVGTPAVHAYELGDSRSAVVLRAVSSRRALAGVVMVIMDTRVIKRDDKGTVQLMTPKLQRALAHFADMRTHLRPDVLPDLLPDVHPPAAPAQARVASAPATRSAAPLELSLVDSGRILRPAPPVTPDIDRLKETLRRSPIALHVQQLVPLTKGSQLKRYEVLLRIKSDDAPTVAPHALLKAAAENGLGSVIDRRVVTELISWLVHHPDVWRSHAVMLSVNLTTTALHDEHFIKFVDQCLAKSSLPRSMIAFEVDVPAAVQLGDRMFAIADALHGLGCPLVLDDFGLRTECFDLLRLPAVRYIKLAPKITSKMRSDKISQAAISAVVQMARVLGMHTVAKRTEPGAEQEWLTALGVDFVQSNSFSPAVAIETLSGPTSSGRTPPSHRRAP